MADSHPLAGLLDRAGRVFTLADQLGRAFRDEYDRQGDGLRTVDPTAWFRHEADFNTFSAAVLDLRDEMQNPPNGFVPVAQVLLEAARIAKRIRDIMQTTDGDCWQSFVDYRFHLSSIFAKGSEAISATTKVMCSSDPFAFLDISAKKTHADPICTTPTISKPPAKLIEAAERSIPLIIADVPVDALGQHQLGTASHFITRMQKAGHTLAAAQWAIHESVIAGRLETGPVAVSFPSVKTEAGWRGGGRGTKWIPKGKPASFDSFNIFPTPAMFTWWQSRESNQPKPESTTRATDSLPDPFAKLSRLEELGAVVEKLAAEFWASRKPLSETLDALPSEDPDCWLATGRSLSDLGLGEFPVEMASSIKLQSVPTPEQVAQQACWNLLVASVEWNRDAIESLLAEIAKRPRVKESLSQIRIAVQESCLAKWRIQTSPAYIARFTELLDRLGMDANDALEWMQRKETSLTPPAQSALRGWLDSLLVGQAFAPMECASSSFSRGPEEAESALFKLARSKVRENMRSVTAAEIWGELRPLGLLDHWTEAVLRLEARGVLIAKERPLPTGSGPGDAMKRIFLQRSGPTLWQVGPNVIDDAGTPPATPVPETCNEDVKRNERRKGIPRAEAEVIVRDWLKEHAMDNPAAITRDAVAQGTGLSTGAVSNTPAWKAFRARRDAESNPGMRTIPLSDAMLAEIPVECEPDDELAKLIKEQEEELAEDSRRHERRHRPS